jgi:trehalose 6-phosphate synthase
VELDPMSRLIVVSNRVSPPGGGDANQGGLAVALAAALRESDGIWFGWSGEEVERFTGAIDYQRNEGVTTATIDLEPQDTDEYYNGYANRTLWPLFHYRIDLAEYERSFAGGYARVNARFADTLRPLIGGRDLIWVHD